ncbi:MAG: hypothetical protein V4596_01810 [Bdellovibrionota bacterium]
MRILSIILTIFMAVNVAAWASTSLCNLEKSSCSAADSNCMDDSSTENESNSEHSDSTHAHCASYCAHHYAHPSFSASIQFPIIEPILYHRYSFILIQTYPEGPFRPPLS